VLLVGQQQNDPDEQQTGSLVDWQLAGSCMLEDSWTAASAETRAARSSQQPLSFVPPANVQPRTRATRISRTLAPSQRQPQETMQMQGPGGGGADFVVPLAASASGMQLHEYCATPHAL
jgi:hypothetical protein